MAAQAGDPRYCNFFLDANALDRGSDEKSAIVDAFHEITEELGINPTKSFGVQNEIQHPNTPDSVRHDMGGIYTIQTALTPDELDKKRRIRAIMTGNAKSGKHIADADHLFDAAKYGGGYFITHDDRIRRRQREICEALSSDIEIVALAEFVEICESVS